MSKNLVFSARSQRSFEQQFELERQLHRCVAEIGRLERKIAELEEQKAWHLREKLSGGRGLGFFGNTLADLEDHSKELAVFKQQRAALEAQIEALRTVTPEELAERTPKQQQLADLAAARLAARREADEALQALHAALKRDAALTAQMKQTAAAVEFTFAEDGLDTRRFDELAAALPASLAPQSEQWHAWFTGRPQNVKPYVVRDECLIVPETLAHSGVYYFGERIDLSEAHARELLREDRPAPTNDEPWRSAPPSVLALEAWEAAQAEAKEKGITIEQVFFWQDVERSERDKAAGRSRRDAIAEQQTRARRAAGFHTIDLANVEPKVKLRAKTRISAGEKNHIEPGAIFEAGQSSAGSLVRTGAASRP